VATVATVAVVRVEGAATVVVAVRVEGAVVVVVEGKP
jgi:hypothetical protein